MSSRALCRSWPNGFSIDHAAPRVGARRRPGPSGRAARRRAGRPRRDRQVERVVAAGAALGVEALRPCRRAGRTRRRRRSRPDEAEALASCFQTLSRNGVRACSLHRVVHDLAEVLVGPVAAGEADQREARRQQPAVGEVVDGRHELLAGEVARDAEDHQAARPGDARQPLVARVAQRVAVGGDPGWAHSPGPPAVGAHRLGAVGEVQAQHRAAVVGEHLRVAGGLRGDELAEGERPGPVPRGRSAGEPVICRKTPVGGPPLWYWPVECRKRGPQPNVVGRCVRRASAGRTLASRPASASRSR